MFESGEKEWMSMSYGARIGYFAQNGIKLFPLALLFAASVLVSIFMSMVPSEDLAEYARLVGLALVAAFLLMTVWSTLLVLLSMRRSKHRRRQVQAPWMTYRQKMRANQNFISDAAWQREGSKFYARLAADEPKAEPVVAVGKMPPASVRVPVYAVDQVEVLA